MYLSQGILCSIKSFCNTFKMVFWCLIDTLAHLAINKKIVNFRMVREILMD